MQLDWNWFFCVWSEEGGYDYRDIGISNYYKYQLFIIINNNCHHYYKYQSFLNALQCHLCHETHDNIYIEIFLYSVLLLICLPVLVPIPHFLNCCSFVINLDIWLSNLSHYFCCLPFYFKIVLVSPCTPHFHIHLRNNLIVFFSKYMNSLLHELIQFLHFEYL